MSVHVWATQQIAILFGKLPKIVCDFRMRLVVRQTQTHTHSLSACARVCVCASKHARPKQEAKQTKRKQQTAAAQLKAKVKFLLSTDFIVASSRFASPRASPLSLSLRFGNGFGCGVRSESFVQLSYSCADAAERAFAAATAAAQRLRRAL